MPFRSSILCISIATILLVGCSAKPTESGIQPVVPPATISAQTISGIEDNDSAAIIDEASKIDAVVAPIGQVSNRAIGAGRAEARQVSEVVASGDRVRIAALNSVSSAVVSNELAYDRLTYHPGPRVLANTENYTRIDENEIKRVSESPVSTFSIDVDTAAYSNLRRMLTREGRLPPFDAVRLEEMINYFDYDYPSPDSLNQPLAITTEMMVSPWNPDNHLLMVGIQGFEPALDQRPNANLVFLVDVSGSMQSADKLGLVKQSLHLLVSQMGADDRIALVVYAGAAGVVLESTSADKKSKIRQAIDSLSAGGSTNGGAGIELAYRIAEENKIEDGINRVIIASDGDLNVGITSIEDLKELIIRKRENDIALTSLGFGTGNYNYSLMEQLADVGNGNAAYIDSLSEARKVLVEEMQSTLLTIAKDVKIQVEFNPAVVAEYRLIGYENRVLNREDFRNDNIDAGEIGAGHTVTALYEVSLRGSRGAMIPDRRYAQPDVETEDFSDELAYVNIRYKLPDADRSTEFGVAVRNQNIDSENLQATENIRFAAAVAGFGQLLRGGKHTADWDYDELLLLARESRGDDVHGYRSELLGLVELAKILGDSG
ncbi:MAG: VWA domain-containing protein [Proteobacteria bacterium]|nr:VWA domain-containing protein [Pseudomonadota bacterium]